MDARTELFIGAYLLGWVVGFAVAWWIYRKPPVVKIDTVNTHLLVDQAFANKIDGAVVAKWLDGRGLTWMPKGAAFDPHKVVNK